ncbi:heme-binding protein [Stieleria varia]|uniref:SOUL heme-binding protein n=1 Tax=Stieleria varia TaxID=2528005 RepID=A0A5C6ATR9_9BACT|nr:heme-binding protein [Stieleria varia]TWU02811.1 SOUL heme-binding protein [Stieleria varia]
MRTGRYRVAASCGCFSTLAEQNISGANEAEQKIAMTTPVFMEGEIGQSDVSMGFVMAKEVAANGVSDPKGEGVKLRERKGGRFAVKDASETDSEATKDS